MITNDDPRLTAYALDELTDDDRSALEAELQVADPTAKAAIDAEIESIRAVAATLAGELKAEVDAAWARRPSLSFSEDHERGAHATKPRFNIGRVVVAAAAAVVVGGLTFSILLPEKGQARRSTVGGQTLAKERAREVALAMASRSTTQPPASVKGEAQPLKDILTYPGNWPDLSRSAAGKVVASDQQASYARLDSDLRRKHAEIRRSMPGLVVADADGDGIADARLVPAQAGMLVDASASVLTPQSERDKVLASRDPFLDRLKEEQRVSNLAESYAAIHDNTFLDPRSSPLSTFGIDVDTASYSNIRRYLESGQRPPADAVRIEELINYFPTSDAPPTDGRPFAVRMEVAACPWQPEHRLVRIAIKGKTIAKEARPPSNLVFLVDVSGSMNQENKLPLVKRSLRKLVGQLGEDDRVAIVVYAGNSGLALPSTNASDKTTILSAIDQLEAGGSTNGGQGIELAYSTAMEHLAKDGGGNGGSNRVILCTDGDFNVGVTDRGQLFNLIAEKAKAGVFLNVLGFGTGNTKDDTMEGLADKGNGQYGYIDSDREADKVFVEGLSGTLVTIAKDVKLQLEFNPGTVKSYRLIGYENRVMAAQDFNNDLKDSGDLGAGHNVVALYEIDPARGGAVADPVKTEPALKYQPAPKPEEATRLVAPGANTTELLTLKLRYKRPDAPLEQGTSDLIETTLDDRADASIGAASNDMRFAAAVAGFGMMLRESPNRGACTWELVRSLARGGIGEDAGGHRSEFLNLIDTAQKAH